MAGDYTVEVLTSHSANWQDVTGKVSPDWQSAQILGEPSFGQFAASNLGFTFGVDALYWIHRLAESTADVRVRLSKGSDVLFYGYVDPAELTYKGEYEAGFTAVSLLGLAQRKQLAPFTYGGENNLTWFSGRAKDFYEIALRQLGCLAGSEDDVVLNDYCLTDDPEDPVQADADWSRTRIYRGIPRVDTECEYGLGDVVLSTTEDTTIVGFTLWGGALYRIQRSSVGTYLVLSPCYKSGTTPFTTSGYRLFRFLGPGGAECLAIVEAALHPGYSMTKRVSPLWGIGAVAAGVGLAAIPGLQGAGLAAAEAGIGIVASVGSTLTAEKRYERQGGYFWAVTGVRVISVGDGTNGDAGTSSMGDAFDEEIGEGQGLINEQTAYTPADSVCTDQSNDVGTAPGRFWFCGYNSDTNKFKAKAVWWETTGTPAWHARAAEREITGALSGGMAARDGMLVIGRDNGVEVLLPDAGIYGSWLVVHMNHDHNLSRFIGALSIAAPTSASGSIIVPIGNGSTYAVKASWEDKGGGTWTHVVGMQLLTGADAIHCCQAEAIDLDTPAATGLPCIVERAMSDGTIQRGVGLILDDFSVTWQFAEDWKPLPNSAEDFRPPLPYWDASQGIIRCAALSESLAGQRVITSLYSLGLYAVPFIHIDIEDTPLTIADVLRSVTSFNAILRLHSPTACNSADDVRIISRHAWEAVSAGAFKDEHVRLEPMVTGCEWYDGAETTADGIRIYGGTGVKSGRSDRVWRPPSTLFLSSAWAQVMCDEAVARFPKPGTVGSAYPYGRRIFSFDARARLDTTEKTIGMGELQKSVGLLMGLTISTGIIRSVGINGAGVSTPVTLIESAPDGGVNWEADEPEPDPEAVAQIAHQTYTMPTVTPTYAPVGTAAESSPLLTAQTNTTYDAPWAFWMPIDLTRRGGLLRGYRYGLFSTGLSSHGECAVQMWTDAGGVPGEPIDGTQATSAHTGLVDAVDLTLDVGTNANGYYYLKAGRYWLAVTIDQLVGSSVNPPPIEWRSGTVVAKANIYRWSFALLGSFDFVDTWPGLSGGNPAIATATYPSFYLLME